MKPSPLLSRVPGWAVCLAAALLVHGVLHLYVTYVHYGTMHFPRTVPAAAHSGADLSFFYERGYHEFFNADDPRPKSIVALTFIFPFLALPMRLGYPLMLAAIVAAHGLAVWAAARLAGLAGARAHPGVLGATAVAALFSYGMEFELERGQQSLLITAACLLAVRLFHTARGRAGRVAACAVITLAFLNKLWPGIYLLCLVRDPRAWRENLLRAGGVVLFAAAMILLTTPGGAAAAGEAIGRRMDNPMIWAGNHSIASFTGWMTENGAGAWAGPARLAAWTVVVASLALVAGGLYLRRLPSIQPAALAVCLVCSLVIPAESNDYKLSAFAGAGGVLLAVCADRFDRRRAPVPGLALFTATAAYACTHYSYVMKRPFGMVLTNNLPPLLLFLAATLVLLLPDLFRPRADADDAQAASPATPHPDRP